MKERTVFQTAIDINDLTARAKYLDEVCGTDTELRRRVEELLQASDRAGDFLEKPIFQSGENLQTTPTIPAGRWRAPSGETTLENNSTPPELFPSEKLSFLSPSDSPGSIGKLGHYEILEMIGQGAFGMVLKARDVKLQRTVAIKVMQPHLAATSPPRKRFLREARAGAAIRHQNVVSVYSVEEAPIPYLVMEFIDGITLQEKIDEAGPLENDQIVSIALQLASALQAAHATGVIHRDIKPSNILLENSFQHRVIITDFGLARTVDDASLTQSGMLTGTPMYMSPEQAHGRSLDARSDLFSLGSVLYIMMTGRAPFRAPTTVAVLKRVAEARPRPIKELIPEAPDWLCQIIQQLHAQKPEDRIQSASDLVRLLAKCQVDLLEGGNVLSATLKKISPAKPTQAKNVITEKVADLPPAKPVGSSAIRPLAGLRATHIAITALCVIAAVVIAAAVWAPERLLGGKIAKKEVDAVQAPPAAIPVLNPLWDRLPPGSPKPAVAPFDAETAKSLQEQWGAFLNLPVEYTNRIGIKFRLIPPGEFDMGITEQEMESILPYLSNGLASEEALRSEVPRHRVMITEPFYLAATEISQGQYELIRPDNNSSFQVHNYFKDFDPSITDTSSLAIEGISLIDALHFCRLSGDREGLSWPYEIYGNVFRRIENSEGYYIPTEAQWEYACRAGTESRYWSGESITELRKVAHFGDRDGTPKPIAQLRPNAFGLYDMLGNVYEWTQDRWEANYYKLQANSLLSINPTGSESPSNLRVARGGDFYWSAIDCRSSTRLPLDQSEPPGYAVGIRLALPCSTVRTLLSRPSEPRKILDFRETHGLPISDLPNWVEKHCKPYVPISINLRESGESFVADIVAVQQNTNVDFELHISDSDFGDDFLSMSGTHRCGMRIAVPIKNSDKYHAIALWLNDSQQWVVYEDLEHNIDSLLLAERNVGRFPVHYGVTKYADGKIWGSYCVKLSPGIGHYNYRMLSMAEYLSKVEYYRQEGWRPHTLRMDYGFDDISLSAIFRENTDKVGWDVSVDLLEKDFEQMLVDRKAAGYYPLSVVSYMKDGELRYLVSWEEMK